LKTFVENLVLTFVLAFYFLGHKKSSASGVYFFPAPSLLHPVAPCANRPSSVCNLCTICITCADAVHVALPNAFAVLREHAVYDSRDLLVPMATFLLEIEKIRSEKNHPKKTKKLREKTTSPGKHA
jgi:hypothetical protein